MSFLKQGVSLVLVGAGLALAPLATSADASSPAPLARPHVASGHGALGSVAASGEPGTSGSAPLPHALQAAKDAGGRQAFLLVLDGASTSTAYQQVRQNSTASAASAAAKSRLTAITRAQDAVVSKLPSGSSTLYTTHAVLPGVAVTTDASNVDKLVALPGVASVHPIAPKSIDNSYAIPFQGGKAAWENYGALGNGTSIAIIDTGIDYTHSNFGGPGTVAAYNTAKGNLGAAPGLFPGAKVVGGTDLVGDDYQAGVVGHSTPVPDAYPLDCNGHGSHVAGTASGLGVNADGSTYRGAYDASTDTAAMRIGPGFAPKAKLYAYRVFGCTGSTDVVAEAIDMAADPNNDGDTSDHVDVINMSLGSDFGLTEDGDTVAATAAAAAGILVSNSAGNSGDVEDVSGSPGNAPTSITVANSADAFEVTDDMQYKIDGGATQHGSASRAVLYNWATGPDLTGQVVLAPADNQTACTAYSPADAALVAGKVVLVKWTQEALECGSIARGLVLRNAGASGFIFANSAEHASAGINGDTVIPGVLLAKSAADAIKTAINGGHTVTVTGTVPNSLSTTDTTLNDTINSSSSRGIHLAGNVKPDIAAVGTSVFSTGSGTGNEGVTESGTSMASPMVAGSAALVIQRHPDWTPEQVKAALMNTAGNDVFTGTSHTGDTYAPNRVGAGRLQTDEALATNVLAYNGDDHGVVSVSFGPVEVTGPVTQTKHLTVENTSTGTHTFAVSYDPVTEMAGVTYSVSPSTVTLTSHQSKTVTVTLSITGPNDLAKTIDPTETRLDPVFGPAPNNLPRESLSDASGRVVLAPTAGGGPDLRVPVYSAPRPASTMTQASQLVLPTGTDTGTLHTTGADLGTGGHNGTGTPDPTDDIYSLAAGFELTAKSGAAPKCDATVTDDCWDTTADKSADLKYVGVTSDAPYVATAANRLGYFGISTQQAWETPSNNVEFDIYMDTTGDHVPDYVAYNYRLYNGTTPSAIMVVNIVKLSTGAQIDQELLYDRFGDLDVAAYDSDSMVMPVWLSGMGITAANPTINYGISAFSAYNQHTIDSMGFGPGGTVTMAANMYQPGITVTEAGNPGPYPLVDDVNGGDLTVARTPASYTSDGGQGILMLHLHNKVGNKAQVVNVASPTTTTGTHSPEPSTFGSVSSLTVHVAGDGATPTGSVVVKDGTTTLGTATLASGSGEISLPATLSVGVHTLSLEYSGDATHAPSTGSATATVAKATGATVTATHTPEPSTFGTASSLTVHVTSSSGTPTGTVTVKEGATTLGTGTLASGTATVALPATLAVGAHTLSLAYSGDGSFEAATGSATATVAKAPARATTTSATASPKKIEKGKPFTVTATVTASGATPTGTVTVLLGSKLLGSGTLGPDGKVTISITKKLSKKLKQGSNTLTVQYGGTADFTASQATVTVKVKKKKHH